MPPTRRRLKRNSRRGRRSTAPSPLSDKPFRPLQNPYAPLEVLSQEQIAQIHDASLWLLEQVGIDFLDEEALAIWQAAGARVDHKDRHVWMERGLIMEAIRQAPTQFTMQARNAAHNLQVGGNHINFATVGAAPYYSDMKRGRLPGRLVDFKRMVKLAQQCGPIHIVEGLLVEPQDIPVVERNLEKGLALFTLCDKVITVAAHGRQVASDYVNMGAIVFGGLEAIKKTPVIASNVNVNSPLRYDRQMLGALIVYARNAQPVIVTPFILAGAMSPVTLAAAITQQNAEALAGIALTQIIHPGTPVVYGGFATNIDMQSGSPAFGTPEGAIASLCGAQLARFYQLPFRASGGLNTAKTPDAQAAYETQMSLWPAVLGHANIILHSAGWLEAGLVCSMEKFILDVEGLAMMHRFLQGLEISDETLALESIAQVGPGGHHFGTPHTLDRYRNAFYLPLVSNRQNYEAWRESGAPDASQRAHQVAKQLISAYERPPMEEAVEEALVEYVTRRKVDQRSTPSND